MPSAKSKAFLKQAKGKKAKQQLLEDADDYLASATDLEDAVGKHRGGDPVKSLRFAYRALDLYTQGLSKYPKSFDLAYNKARLELEIATHPVLVKNLDVPVDSVLQQALESHRYALGIDTKNADLLFNMSQLLTTVAERIAKDDDRPDLEAIQYLEEALKYQTACLEIQNSKFKESHEQILDDAFDEEDEDGGAKLDIGTTENLEKAEEGEQWFSVVEPVTAQTLVDTVLAQLETLTTLCSIVNASLSFSSEHLVDVVNPSQIEAYSSKVLNDILPTIIHSNATELKSREVEIELIKANFLAMFLELTFRSRSVSVQAYRENLSVAFASPAFASDALALVAQGRALIAFNSALLDLSPQDSAVSIIRWNALSDVQNLLTNASKLPASEISLRATTHALRGDTSLLLCSLSEPPFQYPQAMSNRVQLLQNAEIFYRNAAKLYDSLGSEWTDEKQICQFRSAVVHVLHQSQHSSSNTESNSTQIAVQSIPWNLSTEHSLVWVKEQLGEMVDDGLITHERFAVS